MVNTKTSKTNREVSTTASPLSHGPLGVVGELRMGVKNKFNRQIFVQDSVVDINCSARVEDP